MTCGTGSSLSEGFTLEQGRRAAEAFELRALPADFYTDPFRYYRALREYAPVKRLGDGSYLLTRFSDCMQVYKDPKLFSSDKKQEFRPKFGDSLLYEHHTTSLVFNDPPLHTRVRRIIMGALTPRAIAQMQPGLEMLVEGLLDDLARRSEVDLIEDFASRIPIEIIGNLLNVPHAERGPLRAWSLAILSALEPVVTPETFSRGNAALREFIDYLDGLVARRRSSPGDPERDVLTRLIQGDEAGERLTSAELVHNCIFLLNAGHETTTNLIGNGLMLLHRHAGERQRLLAHPELIKTAIDECLRMESPNQLGNRMTKQNTQIAGVPIPAGTSLTLCIGAANRDPAQFPDPERFDIARTPNRHLAFGSGIHHCVGLHLAHLEGEIAIARFVRRFPRYELGPLVDGHTSASREAAGAIPVERKIPAAIPGGRARFRGFLTLPCALGT